MKKFVFVFAFLLFGFEGFGQGNLQFNQVMLNDYPFTAIDGLTLNDAATLSVPPGKIWKIESASAWRTIPQGYFSTAIVNVNNMIVFSSKTTLGTAKLPIWLPEGTHKIKVYIDSGGGPYSGIATLSIIEYNIIP